MQCARQRPPCSERPEQPDPCRILIIIIVDQTLPVPRKHLGIALDVAGWTPRDCRLARSGSLYSRTTVDGLIESAFDKLHFKSQLEHEFRMRKVARQVGDAAERPPGDRIGCSVRISIS